MRIATYQKQGLTPSEIAVKYGHLSLASPQTSELKQFGESSGTSKAARRSGGLDLLHPAHRRQCSQPVTIEVDLSFGESKLTKLSKRCFSSVSMNSTSAPVVVVGGVDAWKRKGSNGRRA